MRGPISYRIRCLKVCLVAIAQRRQKNLAYAQQERWQRGRILNSAEEFDECRVCSFFFHQAAGKTKLEYAIPQGVRVFRTLPDEASEAGFDFERSDCRDPRHAHQKGALTKEKRLSSWAVSNRIQRALGCGLNRNVEACAMSPVHYPSARSVPWLDV